MAERTFIVQGQDLARITKWAEKATDSSTAENNSIVVKIKESRLFMQAYNGIRSVETATSITQNFPDDIRFSVNAQLLGEAVKKMEKYEIKASFERTKLVLSTTKPRMKYVLPIHVPRTVAELPELPEQAGTVDTKVFKDAISDVSNAVVTEDLGLPVLETIKISFQPQNKLINLIATDRYVIVNRIIPYEPNPKASQENFHLFVKPSSIKDALSSIVDEDSINLFAEEAGNNLFGMGTNIARMSTLTINVGRAPALEKLLVSASEHSMIVSRSELMTALTNLRSASGGGGVTIAYMKFADESLSIESDPEQKETKDVGFEMEVDVIEHNYTEDFELKTNAQYVTNVLKASKTKNVKIVLSPTPEGKRKPVLVLEVDDENKSNPNFTSLFMPLSG